MLFENIRKLAFRYREIISYIIFGVFTTIVNFIVYVAWCAAFPGSYANVSATAAAWVAAVLFAYLTNRKWVFKSRTKGLLPVLAECAAFFGSRIFSGVIDLAIMYFAVDIMLFDGKIVKLLSNILVIIINYILSKLFIFRGK